jgi:ribosomal protein L32E
VSTGHVGVYKRRIGLGFGSGLTFATQIGYGSNRKTRHLMPSGHKAFLVSNGTIHRAIARATEPKQLTKCSR